MMGGRAGKAATALKEMGYGKANIGLEKGELGNMWIPRPLNDIELLIKSLPDGRFVDGDKVIWGCRMIKSELEVDRLTKAAAIHRQAFQAVIDKYRPGMTEQDIGKILMMSAAENGKLDTVKYLIDKGANVHAKKRHGVTALKAASDAGRTHVVNLLSARRRPSSRAAVRYQGCLPWYQRSGRCRRCWGWR